MSPKIATTFRTVLLAGVSLLAAGAAYAQDEPASVNEPTDVEEIVVVGSQIKGAKVTDVLPVTVLEVEDIEASAPTSGDDLFRSIPQAGDVTFNESRMAGGINDARGDTASINLRALGTGNTLMLLNGRRMVLHPAIQVENLVPVATVNTNTIPVVGVRRIEVLRDGASAIYGTDAVAGVVNTVLKSSFDGFTITAQASEAEDSDMQEYDLDFEWGHDFNGGRSNISVFGAYTARDPLWARERDFSSNADMRRLVVGTPFETETDFNNTSTDTVWSEFQRLTASFVASTTSASYNGTALTTSGIFHVQPATNEGCIAPAGTGICYDNSSLSTASTDANLRYNTAVARTLIGDTERVNLFGFFNHEFENGIEVFAEAGGFFSSYWGSREQDTPLATQRMIVPITGYWNPFGPTSSPNRLPLLTGVATTGVPIELIDYRALDAGDQTITVDQEVTRYLAGVRGEWRQWDWESAYVYSRAETNDVMRAISLTLFQAAISRTGPDAYNPFNGGDPANPSEADSSPNPQAVIDTFVVDVGRESHTSLAMWDFKVSNPEFVRNWAGSMGVAAGIEFRRETYGDDRDPRLDGTLTFTDLAGVTTGSDVTGVSPTPDTSGARSVQAAYAELAMPFVSPEMDIPLVRSLDAQIAMRWENYTTFGSVAKPKVALSWYPVEWLQVRTGWSQGFRAPNLPQMFERGIMRSNSRTDWIRCEAGVRRGLIANFNACTASGTPVVGATVSVVSNRSGSQTLTPEESENFTAGLVFVSTMMPRQWGKVTATVDYWKVEQTDIIGIFGDANALALDWLLRTQGSSNPNVVRAAPTADEITFFTGSGLTPVGRVSEVVDNYRNLGPREVEGVDFGLFYEIDDTPWGDFDVKVNAAKLLTFFQTPGSEQQAILDAQASGALSTFPSVAGAEGLIRQNGRPEWRLTTTFTWRKGGLGAGYYNSYTSDVDDTSAALADETLWVVDEWLIHNIYVQYSFTEGKWLDGTRVKVGVRNLTNEMPPLADNDVGFVGDLHSPRGATYYAQVRKRF